MLGEVVEPAWGADDDMRGLGWILELCLVVLQGDAAEIAAETEFRLLEVSAFVMGVLPNLLKSLKI